MFVIQLILAVVLSFFVIKIDGVLTFLQSEFYRLSWDEFSEVQNDYFFYQCILPSLLLIAIVFSLFELFRILYHGVKGTNKVYIISIKICIQLLFLCGFILQFLYTAVYGFAILIIGS